MKNTNICLYYPYKKQYIYELSNKLSFCINCSSVIFIDNSGNKISTIKPLKYDTPQESTLPIFLTKSNNTPYVFLNKPEYLKIRKEMVKNMKLFCKQFNINMKTFFLSLHYFDRICSRILAFDVKALKRIYKICIILAAKFLELHPNWAEIQKLASAISTNYAKDEAYVLYLLKYDLATFTSYDFLHDLLYYGFLFNDEQFPMRKMHAIYTEIDQILYLFSESKNYIDMTPKEISLAIIGFIRETLGLAAFGKNIQLVYMNEFSNSHSCIVCLNKLKKCFKLILINNPNHSPENTNSDSNTDDSNSDEHSGDTKEINSQKNENIKKADQEIINNIIKTD